MGMAHRRGYGSGAATFALLLAALSVSAGCGNSGAATGDDGGLAGDRGAVDGAADDVVMVGDAGPLDGSVVPTDNGMTNDAGGGSDVVAVDATDGGETGDGGAGDGGTGDGGTTRRGHAGSSIVSAGSVMQSARFQMISTLGGRSVQQTYLQSPNYRLRGGLVGTIGAR